MLDIASAFNYIDKDNHYLKASMKPGKAREAFVKHLREKGLRTTSQRDRVLNAFLAAKRHITVDELFAIVRKEDPSIGYATVHRNLNLLRDSGIAEEIKIGNQKARFEPKIGHEHHDHLICTRCGNLIEVYDTKIEELQEKLAAANDFLPERHKLEIYGVCKECR